MSQGAVPYRTLFDDERSLSAAFFRAVQIGSTAFVGGLLLLDARGEPLEFTYTRVDAAHRFLWRESTLRSGALRELAVAVFDACPRTPTMVFCLASEVEPDLFAEELDVERPLARVAAEHDVVGVTADETHELVPGRENTQLLWVRGRPSELTEAHRLVELLAKRGLLVEPFERVLAGLREVYGAELEGLEHAP